MICFSRKKLSVIILFSIITGIYFSLLPPSVYCQNRNKVWKIAIFRTQPPYAAQIEKGLKDGLKKLGYIDGKNISFFPTNVVPGKVEDFSETMMRIQKILKQHPDIVATIGTQASLPARSILENAGIPMIFAGVSYPVESGLIEAFDKPTGKNRTGVSYSIPLEQRLKLIRRIFPDISKFKKIAFAYSTQVLQDVMFADKLKLLREPFGWEFIYIDFFDYAQNDSSCMKLIKALDEKKPDIVFGWHSLDLLGEDEECIEKIIGSYRKPILAVTSNLLRRGGIAGILSDHSGLGFQQAKMVDAVIKGENAGDIPPIEPIDYLIELNLKKAVELGINFNPNLIEGASKVIQ